MKTCDNCRHLFSNTWRCKQCKIVDDKPNNWEYIIFNEPNYDKVILTCLLLFVAVASMLVAKSLTAPRYNENTPYVITAGRQAIYCTGNAYVTTIEHGKIKTVQITQPPLGMSSRTGGK